MEKYVLVTGSASGIGEAIAREYAAHGNNIVLVDINEDKMKETQAEWEPKYGIKVLPIKANLFDDSEPERIRQTCLDNNAQVQVLVNCAGIGAAGEFHTSDWKRQKGIVDLDVIALMHMTYVFLPDMVERHSGQVINIASNAGFMPLAPQPTYGAAKAFVISWTQALYETYHARNVDFTVICPGPTKTAFFKDAGFNLKKLKGATPESVGQFVYRKGQQKVAMASHGFATKVESVMSRLAPRALVRKVAKIAAEN